MKFIAISEIQHNLDGRFETTNDIDEETGEYRVRAVSTVLKAGQMHEVEDSFGTEMIRIGAAREPSEQELILHSLANGARVEA